MLYRCGKEKQELVLQERELTGRNGEPSHRSEGLAPAGTASAQHSSLATRGQTGAEAGRGWMCELLAPLRALHAERLVPLAAPERLPGLQVAD